MYGKLKQDKMWPFISLKRPNKNYNKKCRKPNL